MRFFGGTIIEVVCYGAGVLGVGFQNYLIATALAHSVLGVPVFYIAGSILNGKGAFLSILFLCVAFVIFYKLKHRYFEYNEL